jgi:predicted MPP superfamily phosphohydrolase
VNQVSFYCQDGDCREQCEACGTMPNMNFEDIPEFEQRLDKILSELKETLIRKNHDYGDSFSKQFQKYGITSYLIRDEDKTLRLESLVTKEAKVSESTRDTVLDKAGYAILTLMEL